MNKTKEDTDLQNMMREELIAEVEKLHNAISKHRDCSGHDLCWFQPDLWNLLPEKYDVIVSIPEWDKFMEGCIRYRKSLDEQLPNALRTAVDFDEAETRHTQAIDSTDIENILKETLEAYGVFQKMPLSHKNEYIQWINAAQKQETKERRLKNDKYVTKQKEKPMKKLIVISDLWGVKQSQWWQYYTETLSKHFEVIFYDACQLGQIDVSQYTEAVLHQQFMDGGVLQSVQNLTHKEKETFAILGFSIGGYIAWRALHGGLKAQHLVAVSSTRLRYETIPPKAQLHLFYGKKDHHLPSTAWYDTMKTSPYLFDEAYHNFYQKEHIAQQICEYIQNKML